MSTLEDEATLVSTFYIGEALFGLHTLDVQEVIPPTDLTPVHHAPGYISGIINLRGQIVTVVNLAERLGLSEPENAPAMAAPTATPPAAAATAAGPAATAVPAGYIIIVAWRGEHVGLQVDRMAEVVTADLDHLEAAPLNVGAFQRNYLRGLCRTPLGPAAVLDVQAVLDEEEDEAASFSR